MNEELKELVEEMQEFLHKGNKLVHKAQKKLGMPSSGMGQRNFPHDLPPAYPQYPGEFDTWMNRMGERNSGGMYGNGMGQRNNRGSQDQGGDFDMRYM